MSLYDGLGATQADLDIEDQATPTREEAISALILRMARDAVADPKSLHLRCRMLIAVSGEQWPQVQRRLASAYAKKAAREADHTRRSRLFKTLRRYVPLRVAYEAFEARGLRLLHSGYRGDLSKVVTICNRDFGGIDELCAHQFFPREAVPAGPVLISSRVRVASELLSPAV